jgi:hypothetical protein
MKKKIFFIALLFLCLTNSLKAQNLLSGVVFDERNIPIPFAKIYVKNSADLRTLSDVNGYFEMRLFPGEYYLVISSPGYDERETYISVSETSVERNVQLFPTRIQDLEDIEISVNKSNPGRDIMLEVVKVRDKINPWNYTHSCEGYIKAYEKIEHKEKSKEKKKEKEEEAENSESADIEDPFAEKQTEMVNNMNLVEVQFTRHFAPENQVKEIRDAYEIRGNARNLYYTTTVKSNFNFFQNLMHLDDLHQTPVSSPISVPGILSYKYRLEEQYEENGRKIHKIKIIPRNMATTTLEGYIWVIDSLWLIQKLELTMEKGNLLIYDYFTIQQEFDHPGDSMCVLKKQLLDYGVKYKDQSSTCKTYTEFTNYNFNPQFSSKFFGNELSVTEKEAYEKDTSYWAQTRTTSLTLEEQTYILARDSIRDAHNKKEYLDSVDALFNKINIWKVLWFGIDHRNRSKKTQWTINSMAAFIRPLYIAGPRLAPGFSYFKKWDNEKTLDSYSELTLGMVNKDLKGSTWWRYRYDPFHFGTIGAYFSHDFDVIRSFDAITQIYKRSNFIETTKMKVFHEYELFNGFYINPDLEFSERRDVNDYKFVKLLDNSIPNNEPTIFNTYQAMLGNITISYIPQQKYMRERNRKVLLGSKWPTFYLTYERGIPKLFGSDVDHEYGLIGVTQTFKIGTLGTSNYHVKTGKFLSSRNLKDADFKYNRRSDPFWFSNPLYSFQGLDSSLPSKEMFYEGHFIHHDNGAFLNKIPFMKKTGIGLVLGCGALYVAEYDWQHYEIFTGIERNFKFSRRKLRIGIYAILSDGNNIKPSSTWKISFAVLDNRNMKWNF